MTIQLRTIRAKTTTTRGLTRLIGVAALTALSMWAAPAAQATGSLSTTTTLTASPAASTAGTPVTLSANVKVLELPGLGILPTGPVSFTATNGTKTAALGTATFGPCFLTTCTATLTTTAIPVGTTSVKASYAGDGLTAPSSASTAVSVAPNSNPGSTAVVTCYAGQPCDSGNVKSPDNTTTLDVNSSASANNQTVTASAGPGSLHCAPAGGSPDNDGDDDDGVWVGALATFSSTAADSTKTVTYTGSGSVGAVMKHQFSEHTKYAGCYGSPTPFKGYTTGVYGNAPFNATDGLYEAQPSSCSYNGGQKPCVTTASTSTTFSYIVHTLAGDPKFVG